MVVRSNWAPRVVLRTVGQKDMSVGLEFGHASHAGRVWQRSQKVGVEGTPQGTSMVSVIMVFVLGCQGWSSKRRTRCSGVRVWPIHGKRPIRSVGNLVYGVVCNWELHNGLQLCEWHCVSGTHGNPMSEVARYRCHRYTGILGVRERSLDQDCCRHGTV